LAPLPLLALTPTAFTGGFYGAGEVTHSDLSLDHGYFDNALIGAGASGLSSSDKGSTDKWRLQGGYRFNPNLAVEAGYIDFGKAEYQAITPGARTGLVEGGRRRRGDAGFAAGDRQPVRLRQGGDGGREG
jgi:hypothetical protein